MANIQLFKLDVWWLDHTQKPSAIGVILSNKSGNKDDVQ